MRRIALWGIGAGLLLSAASAWAGDKNKYVPPPARFGRRGVFEIMFSPPERPPGKKGEGDKAAAAEKSPARKLDEALSTRAQEEAKLHRRQDVCLHLRQVARDTSDADLERLAQQLDQQAWEVFLDKTSRLPGGTARAADLDRLEPGLPSRASDADRLTAPPSRGKTAAPAVREVNP